MTEILTFFLFPFASKLLINLARGFEAWRMTGWWRNN